MRRGFKAEAERMAIAAREALGIGAQEPLSPWAYAEHLGIVLLEISALELSVKSRKQLLQIDSESWSGMTLKEGACIAIVLNPSHALARQANTLMHEIAHVLLKHVPASVQVSATGMLLLSDYSADQEDEADWLAAALLLPRDALCSHRSIGRGSKAIAAHFGVSEMLCEWRLRMTGVNAQMKRRGNHQ